MADHQSTIALNIGSQRVSMAVFEPSKSGGLVLKAYDVETFLVDPASETSRAAQIRTAIAELVERLGAKGKARYTISGQSVFIRFVKLPPLDDDNIDQLVTFEAQQHVPFPLEEVVWDYEILDAGDEKEVVIVAIKGEALDDLNESVTGAGLGTAEVDVAPMALYNAFRAAYPDLEEPALLVDIGAKTSDLLYIEGDRFFTRSAAVGGSAVTSAISKEFDVPFAEAEAHKTQSGLVALGGGHTEQLDDATAALAVNIRNSMTRLATEIPRTTNYYRSQHNGSAPKRVFLAGGGANLPYAKEFFEEKLRLPVEYFNPLAAITLAKGVDTDVVSKEAHRMGEVIGLGLRGIGKSKLNIDLVPTAVGEAREAQKRRPFLLVAAALLVVGAGLWAYFQSQAATEAAEEAAAMERQLGTLEGPAQAIRRLNNREQDLRAVADPYIDAEADRTFWLDAIQELKAAFASDVVWLVDFEPIYGYDPEGGNETGKPVVKADFARANYGLSSLETIDRVRPEDEDEEPVPERVDAIRVQGFWRDNPRGQNAVYELLGQLRENAEDGFSHFRFAVADEDGEMVPLEEKQLAPMVEAAPAEEEFAAPFTLLLPLSREVPIF